jgi:hypothetical protein
MMRFINWPNPGKVLLILIAPLLVACAGQSVPDRYYLLSPSAGQAIASSAQARVIGVGPITTPSYLDRSTIVTRGAENSPAVNVGHRWAEPLGENINRVLMDNFEQTGKARRLEMFPWTSRDGVELQVVVDIDRFEKQPDGQVVLSARWKLIGFEQGNIAAANRYMGVDQPTDGSVESTVVSMSKLLGGLTAEIASVIP